MSIRCLLCGAYNADGADWCNQCYASLTAPAPTVPTTEPDLRPESPPGGAVLEEPGGADPAWTCPVCEADNPVADERCSTCGTLMVVAFAPPAEDVDGSAAKWWSLVPGGGHAKAGAGAIGLGVFLLVVLAVAFGAVLVGAPSTRLMGGIVLVAGGGVWVASVFDTVRHVETGSGWIFQPRVISVLAGLVIGLLFVAVLVAMRSTP